MPSGEIVRERCLTNKGRPKDGRVLGVRMLEVASATWELQVQLSWRAGEHRVAVYAGTAPKRYKSLSKAVAHCRSAYAYRGPIILETVETEPDHADHLAHSSEGPTS